VIVREAGGTVSGLDGGDIDLESTTIVATNGALHPALLSALQG
jgi:fructose-1,6-bisphosphatase/inositol monophosphatase family enzyme